MSWIWILLNFITFLSADLSTFKACLGPLSSQLVQASDSLYTSLASGARPRVPTAPAAIFLTQSLDQVPDVVKCAYQSNVQPVPRGGGHSYEGFSSVNGSVVISLSQCNNVSLSLKRKVSIAKIQAGARLGHVYEQLWNLGQFTLPAGTCPSVGIGGHIGGGGYGMISRKFGLAADRVVNMTVVLYNGSVVTANNETNSDLFWALRGGNSGSFGIVLEYMVSVVKIPKNTMFLLTYRNPAEFHEIIKKWQLFFPTARNELSTQLTVNPRSATLRGHFLGSNVTLNQLLQQSGMLAFANYTLVQRTNCTGLGSRLFFNFDLTCSNFSALQVPAQIPDAEKTYRKSKSDFSSRILTDSELDSLVNGIASCPGTCWIQFEALGGKISELSNADTPYPHRDMLFSMQYTVYLQPNEPETSVNYQWIRSFENTLRPFVTGFHYQNYPDLDLGSEYGVGYFGKDNYERLIRIKSAYDPLNVFRNAQSIPTSLSNTTNVPSVNPQQTSTGFNLKSSLLILVIQLFMK